MSKAAKAARSKLLARYDHCDAVFGSAGRIGDGDVFGRTFGLVPRDVDIIAVSQSASTCHSASWYLA